MSLLLALTSAGGPTNYADSLNAGSYALSGKTITDVFARNDSLSVGAYAISGKTVTDVYARNDSLSVGAYVISGKTVTDVYARNDALSVGSYALSGKSITDLFARNDVLFAGDYVISGQNITDAYIPGIVSWVKHGGDDAPRKSARRKKRELRADLEAAWAKVNGKDVSHETREEAQALIPPEIENKIAYIARDLEKVHKLFAIVEQQANEQDDEDILMLLL